MYPSFHMFLKKGGNILFQSIIICIGVLIFFFNRTLSNLSDTRQNEELSNDSILGDQDIDVECLDTSIASVQTPPPSDTDGTKSRKRKLEKVSEMLVENRESRLKLIETLKDASQKQEDEVDVFYKSISLSVKRLPPLLRSEIKMQHLQSLHNMELKHMQSQSQYHQPYYPQQNIPDYSLVHQAQTYQPLVRQTQTDQPENLNCPSQSTSKQSFYENHPY